MAVDGMAVHECTKYSEREALRAVFDYLERPVALQKLDVLCDRPPIDSSNRARLVKVAVDLGATAFTKADATLDELKFVTRKGYPVIVAMAPNGINDEYHFAIVVDLDDRDVILLCPQQREHENTSGELPRQRLSRGEFFRQWCCVDHDTVEDKEIKGWCLVLNFEGRELARVIPDGEDTLPVDRRRRNGVLTAAWTMFGVEVVLAIKSYVDVYDYGPPMFAFAFAVIGFALLDYCARPEKREFTSTLSPRWYRGYLPFWCLVPFITAAGASVWVHYQKWCDARADLEQLAHEVKAAVEWPDDGKMRPDDPTDVAVAAVTRFVQRFTTTPRTDFEERTKTQIRDIVASRGWFAVDEPVDRCWKHQDSLDQHTFAFLMSSELYVNGEWNPFYAFNLWVPSIYRERIANRRGDPRSWRCFTTERVNATVENLVTSRYGAEKSGPEAKRFAEIARVVGHDVLIARGDISMVCHNLALDTAGGFTLALGIQSLFIFWIPAMLAVTIARAGKRSRQRDRRERIQHSIELRDHRILAEDEYLFLPRMCFAILLVLGTNYVFAPLGLKATYIMSIVDEHALPGHTTFILWSTSFSQAPVIVVGFVGFLLYALITATQRFALDDFDDRSLLALLVRGLVVILLSFALSSSDINEIASRAFVFIAGVFPVRALEAIATRFNMSIDPDFAPKEDGSFAGLPGLDPSKVFALRAAGIQSTYDLAAMNIEDVAERVRIDPRLLGRAVDRAILIDALGLDLVVKLEPYGITSATELIDARTDLDDLILHGAPTPPEEVAILYRAASACRRRLRTDTRIASVQGWIETKPGSDANVSM